jgi:hypothetical protein
MPDGFRLCPTRKIKDAGFLHANDRDVERAQPEPASQVRADPVGRQHERALHADLSIFRFCRRDTRTAGPTPTNNMLVMNETP